VKKESISSELKVNQCIFNQDFENMYAVMGDNLLFVKLTDFEGVSIPAAGSLLSFSGSKVKLHFGDNINTVEVPLTSFLTNFLSRKDFKMAYKIACLGVSENDFRHIGIEALKNKEFEISRKCFTRTRDIGYLDIINRSEEETRLGTFDEPSLIVELLCYDKKINKALEYLKKEGQFEKAIELCITLRKWNEALALIKSAQSTGSLE
jgi:intraflagellar transport protein 122